MDWINSVSNMDNTIYDICIKDSCLIIYIKTWDQKIRQIIFSNYYAFKEKNSIGREIGDILIQTNSILLEELKEDIVNGDGTIDEILCENIRKVNHRSNEKGEKRDNEQEK